MEPTKDAKQTSLSPLGTPGAPREPRLLDKVHEAISRLHYSSRTGEAYVHWIKRYVRFCGMRHPAKLVAFYESNPIFLTVTGEFVIKNLVLLSAGLVVASTVRRTSDTGVG